MNHSNHNSNELAAKSGTTENLMILLHGLGSNGDDLFSLTPYLKDHLPHTHFYSPDAIEECDMASFGYQWFSLQDRNPTKVQSELERVSPVIDSLIEQQSKKLNLSSENVILCGFSQGSMVSVYLSLQKKYKAVLAFSGAVIAPKDITNTYTPICLIHGMEDDVVDYSNMDIGYDLLKNLGVDVEKYARPNLRHSIDMEGITRAIEFIKKR